MAQSSIEFLKKIPVKILQFPERFKFQLPERYKGTFVEKWHKYWVNLIIDYKEVGADTLAAIKNKPRKAAVYFAGLAAFGYFVKTNPDEQSFRHALVEYMNDVSQVDETVRNPVAAQHLHYIEKCHNANLLRRLNIGFMSFMWVDNYDPVCKLYKAQCTYLKPKYSTFHERIVDVGFLNTWWGLRKFMIDYDVNPSEWQY
ncbi:mitochondrial import inner membrane translocase subunit Tim29 [Hetaerina americana]|uniref:mitochondrial import inner membrane translocase subunit Tim29 n=1 Tax=Hetaerina americana TaxID=62018 RepID=UPI003A7F273C